MSNLLSTAKELLTQQAIEFYQAFLEDVQLDKEEYVSHFANLGEVLYEIESIETFSEFCTKAENGDFGEVGLADIEGLEVFLKRVMGY